MTCDNPNLWLSFFRQAKRAHVEVHNPTDAAVQTKVRPAPGFDLCGTFEEEVAVPPGATRVVDVP